jgi:hypothetical protein
MNIGSRERLQNPCWRDRGGPGERVALKQVSRPGDKPSSGPIKPRHPFPAPGLGGHRQATLPDVDTKPIEPAPPRCCPQCGGTRLVYRELTPAEPAALSAAADSS